MREPLGVVRLVVSLASDGAQVDINSPNTPIMLCAGDTMMIEPPVPGMGALFCEFVAPGTDPALAVALRKAGEVRGRLKAHLAPGTDPCLERGGIWPCDVAQTLLEHEAIHGLIARSLWARGGPGDGNC